MANNDEAGGSGVKAFWELSPLMPPLMVPPRMPPLMMAAHAQMAPPPKRQRKDRRPTVLRTLKEEVTEVDSDGNPTAPERIVKGVLGLARVHSPEHRLDQH